MSVAMQTILTGAGELMATLNAIPERVLNRVFRLGQRKVSRAVIERAKALTPRRNYPAGFIGPRTEHLANRFIAKQKVYRASSTTVNIIGGRSGGHNRINHLVEDGSAQRFTNHKTRYGASTSSIVTRTRKVQTKSGGWRTVRVQEVKRTRRSTGSFATGNGIARNRGKMPAFHQLRRAVEQTPIEQIMQTEIRAGLQRIADRA